MRCILDIESNGLLNDHEEHKNATRLHCLCWHDIDTGESGSITDTKQMIPFLQQPNLTIIGHKIITYDIPLVERFLEIKILARLIDTLGLSWYLYPLRNIHGLDEWGQDLGIEKPPIDDWQGLSEANWAKIELGITQHSSKEQIDEYWQLIKERDAFLAKMVHRCSEDVKINNKLFKMMIEYLKKIYNDDMAAIGRFMDYVSFKLDCAREQEEVRIRADLDKVRLNLDTLQAEKKKKKDILSEIMPPSYKYKIKSKPKEIYKKDGSISSHGQKWFDILKEQGLPEHHNTALKLVDKVNKGNPNSHAQLKEWLFSLGWQPDEFDYKREVKHDYKSAVKAIPQIGSKEKPGELSQSVKDLIEIVPQLEELDSYFVLGHRIGILEGFLETVDKDGFLKAQISGLTNTLRFQHSKPIVNLPTIPKKYWEMIRGCLISPADNWLLCGADMSGLEDNTKHHYMMFFDPIYVKQMRTPGFDPHIDIAVRAKGISYEEGEFYKWYDKKKEGKVYNYTEPSEDIPNRFANHTLKEAVPFEVLKELPDDVQSQAIKVIKPLRLKFKKGNFASVYGAGAPKLSITMNIPLNESKGFHTAYWNRNKAVKLIAQHTIHKTIDGQMWLYNPVSKFWYSLRMEKDKFSTLNQGTGVYAFDIWVKHVRKSGIKIAMQYHDEIMFPLPKDKTDVARERLSNAIEKVNEELKLNVSLGISIAFGNNYADIH